MLELFCIDALEFLRRAPSNCCDLILTDPAYSSLEKHRKTGTTTRLSHSKGSSNDWFPVVDNTYLSHCMREFYRILKPNTHCYIMCDEETADYLKPVGRAHGFTFWKSIVWDKVNPGMGYHYRMRHEFILFFEKGKRKLKNLSLPSILTHKRVYRGYPTEKPVSLLQELIYNSTLPNEVVVDPFMGSGSTGVAAVGLNRAFVGGDLVPAAVALARKRLAALGYSVDT